jgi:tryptophan synthase beta subunit
MMIDRAAMLMLRMELMDAEVMKAGQMTERDQRSYLGWNNTVSRMLRHLGLAATPPPRPSLAQHLAAKAALKPGDAK